MVTETCHAAWQTRRSFAVRLLADKGAASDLASGLPDFLEAVDFAFDWLNREDPGRDGPARLAIFATRDGVTAEVWTYPVARFADYQEVVGVFGFDPVTWVPGVRDFSDESKRPLARRLTAAAARAEPPPDVEPEPEPPPPLAAPPVAPPEPAAAPLEVDPARTVTPERAPLRATLRRSIARTARREWADPVARCCLVFAAAALWLSVALADPNVLILLFASIAGLWWQRRRRAGAPATTDEDDWL